MLKPQDIVILLKIMARTLSKDKQGEVWPQNKLALHLCMSASEVHAGIKRLHLSGLLASRSADSSRERFAPIKKNCEECLVSAVKYFIPVQLKEYTRGIATSYAAPIFENYISIGENDPIPVWPYAEGDRRGFVLEPLYRTVPQSVTQYPDPLFYELLVLVDALRFGRMREYTIAVKLLKEKINYE